MIKVAGGDAINIDFDLPEATGATPTNTTVVNPLPTETGTTAPPPPTESGTGTGTAPPPPPPSRGPVWVGWALTGALAIGAGVTGGLALSKAGAHAELRKKEGVTAEEIESSRSGAKGLAIATDVLIPCALVAGALSLYFSVRTLEPAKAGGISLKLNASPAVGPNGVSGAHAGVSGAF